MFASKEIDCSEIFNLINTFNIEKTPGVLLQKNALGETPLHIALFNKTLLG